MNGKDAVVRLYIMPGQRYWAYTPLQHGGFLVLYAALGQPPTFEVIDSAPVVVDKIREGYERECDTLIDSLGIIVSLSELQREQMIEQAGEYQVSGIRWTSNPKYHQREYFPSLMPIVTDGSVNRYTW